MATLPGLLASRFLAFILHVVVLILCLCLQEQNIKTLKGTLAESEFESERLDYTFRIQIATTILFSLFLVEFTELFTGIFVHRHSLSLLSFSVHLISALILLWYHLDAWAYSSFIPVLLLGFIPGLVSALMLLLRVMLFFLRTE